MEIRATGISLGFAMLNGIIIMLVQVTPIAVEAISWRYFLIFIFMDLVFLIVFYFMYPETSGVPLEEVAKLFGDEVWLLGLEHWPSSLTMDRWRSHSMRHIRLAQRRCEKSREQTSTMSRKWDTLM